MSAPKKITTPAEDPTAPTADREAEILDTVVARVIEALGVDEREVRAIDITANGRIRLVGEDRSVRSLKFSPLERYERDADGRIKR